jgi:hypothetical protein
MLMIMVMLILLEEGKMSKKVSLIVVVALLMAVPVQAHLYDNDFEGHTVGLNAATEQHEGWNWWWPSLTNAVFATDPVEGDKCLDLVGGQRWLSISGYPMDDVTEIHLNYEFDILINDYARWDIYFTDNNTSDVIAPSFNKVGASSVSYKVDGVQTDVSVPGFVTGQWAHCSIQLDQLGENWSMNLAGTQVCLNEGLRDTTQNWAIDTERMIFEVPDSVLIDNLTITVIPEPTTCLLLGLGGLLIRRKRK